jgi:Fur family transcriptional regulator, ferric uptake regulator
MSKSKIKPNKVKVSVSRRNNTQGKNDVLKLLKKASSALSQSDLQDILGAKYDRVTLYRILSTFEKDGLVHRSIDFKGVSRYAMCKHEHGEHHDHDMHVHFSCIKCKKVTCLPNDSFQLNLPKKHIILQTNFMVEGLCGKCS